MFAEEEPGHDKYMAVSHVFYLTDLEKPPLFQLQTICRFPQRMLEIHSVTTTTGAVLEAAPDLQEDQTNFMRCKTT